MQLLIIQMYQENPAAAGAIALTVIGAAIVLAMILVKMTKLLVKTAAILAVLLLAFAIGVAAANRSNGKEGKGGEEPPTERTEPSNQSDQQEITIHPVD